MGSNKNHLLAPTMAQRSKKYRKYINFTKALLGILSRTILSYIDAGAMLFLAIITAATTTAATAKTIPTTALLLKRLDLR